MPQITNQISADEVTYQQVFYRAIYGDTWAEYVDMSHNTDGCVKGVIFEHKTNVTRYGEAKALSQAVIYAAKDCQAGRPVPRFALLVSQEEGKVFVYDLRYYESFIKDVRYAWSRASDGIPGFQNFMGTRYQTISFSLTGAINMQELLSFLQRPAEYVKVEITRHNVVGWSDYYYEHAAEYKQKPEKKAFFAEIREPSKTLAEFVKPWKGTEMDFSLVMDLLNDPMTQKRLGAFYTPVEFAHIASSLVMNAVQEALDAGAKDYIIIDNCAGTGNLEAGLEIYLTGNYTQEQADEIMSHIIVSTYELKEWVALKDRFGNRLRRIVPPPKAGDELPSLNNDGFLQGANALEYDILNDPVVRECIDNPDCAVIGFINPPYIETTGIEFQKRGEGKTSSSWKQSTIVQEMKKEVSGPVTNDMGNVFIWSMFKHYLRKPYDGLIVFSPVKYWKAQHLVNKKFRGGYAFNRQRFHAPTPACVMCAWWQNIDDYDTEEIQIIKVGNSKFDVGRVTGVTDVSYIWHDNPNSILSVKKIHSLFSEKYYTHSSDSGDSRNGIALGFNGFEQTTGKIRLKPIYNTNIVGYLTAEMMGFDNARLHANLLIAGNYGGNGFYLRSDNFLEKLPVFAASRYTDNDNTWYYMSMIMKSGDGADRFNQDVKDGKLNDFLRKCLIWTCLTHYAHMRCLHGSDGRFYRNELCFDGDTIASRKLKELGGPQTEQEKDLINQYNHILKMVRTPNDDGSMKENYDPDYTYGLYQIDEEINLKDTVTNSKGKTITVYRYGDLNNAIKDLKDSLKKYYMSEIVDTLFEYEFLK